MCAYVLKFHLSFAHYLLMNGMKQSSGSNRGPLDFHFSISTTAVTSKNISIKRYNIPKYIIIYMYIYRTAVAI